VELFSLNRQAFAFLIVIAVTVGLMVLLSPFLLFALGGLGVVVLIVVWLRTAVRGRSVIAPFGASEGALALSALLFVIGGAMAGGLMVARVGLPESFSLFRALMPFDSTPKGARIGSRSVNYSDPDTQRRLKEELAKAGVPFTTETREGKEYVGWPREHDAVAEAAQKRVHEGPFPGGRNGHFPDAKLQKDFTDFLTRKGVKHEVVKTRGEDWVYWEATPDDLVKEFMTRRGVDCRKKKPAC
jgi:hypothetical protein